MQGSEVRQDGKVESTHMASLFAWRIGYTCARAYVYCKEHA